MQKILEKIFQLNLYAVNTAISYNSFRNCIIGSLDKYAPFKKRVARANDVPYMAKNIKAISNRSRGVFFFRVKNST